MLKNGNELHATVFEFHPADYLNVMELVRYTSSFFAPYDSKLDSAGRSTYSAPSRAYSSSPRRTPYRKVILGLEERANAAKKAAAIEEARKAQMRKRKLRSIVVPSTERSTSGWNWRWIREVD